eukprot:1347881-Amphidinium_carterae.1
MATVQTTWREFLSLHVGDGAGTTDCSQVTPRSGRHRLSVLLTPARGGLHTLTSVASSSMAGSAICRFVFTLQ